MSVPLLASIQVGLPRSMGREDAVHPMDRPWTSGFFKEPVAGPVAVGRANLLGDGQADLVNHGGVDKAICAYSADHYAYWRDDLQNPALPFGAFGENFTIAGLAETDVCIGDTWRVGPDVEVQVSQPRQPCWKLARRWRIKDLTERVVNNGRTGWYFRVLVEGTVSSGQTLTLIDRPYREWTVARTNLVLHHDKYDRTQLEALVAMPLLSAVIRESLARRLERAEAM